MTQSENETQTGVVRIVSNINEFSFGRICRGAWEDAFCRPEARDQNQEHHYGEKWFGQSWGCPAFKSWNLENESKWQCNVGVESLFLFDMLPQ